MSYRLTDWAMEVGGLTPTQKFVLVTLAHCCNGSKGKATCWPSMPTLVKLTGYSDRAIRRALGDLEARNLIDRRLGSGRKTTVYRLACTDSPNRRLDLEPFATAGDAQPSRAQQAATAGGGTGAGSCAESGADLGRNKVPPSMPRGGERGSAQGGR